MKKNALFFVPGQDPRSRYTAEGLRSHGCLVEDCPAAQADVVVLPMGAAPEAFGELRPGQLIFAGNLGPRLHSYQGQGLRVLDYYTDAQLQWENAVPSAEGAIEILMSRLPITLQGSTGLVIGYGRIGKLLSEKLKLLGARITATARKPQDFGAIAAAGLRPEYTGQYRHGLAQYDYIVNTVPAPVFSTEAYHMVRPDCLLLELASSPGGFDDALCNRHGLQYIRAPGLPGKCAPKTAGHAIAAAIVRRMEMEESS